MTVSFARHADQTTARWLCGTCGRTHPLEPAYPLCCGQRCRMVDADGLPFVTSPEARLDRARDVHDRAYREWRTHLVCLRRELDRTPTESWPCSAWSWWDYLSDNAPHVNRTAQYVDQVLREIAAAGGGEHA